jgi:hypothetical protein
MGQKIPRFKREWLRDNNETPLQHTHSWIEWQRNVFVVAYSIQHIPNNRKDDKHTSLQYEQETQNMAVILVRHTLCNPILTPTTKKRAVFCIEKSATLLVKMNVGNHGIRSPSLQGLMMEITKNRPSIYALCKCRPLERRCWRVLNPTQTDQQKRRKATHTPACYTRREGKLRTWLSYSFAIHFLPQSWHPHLRKTKCVHYHNNNENLYTQSKIQYIPKCLHVHNN